MTFLFSEQSSRAPVLFIYSFINYISRSFCLSFIDIYIYIYFPSCAQSISPSNNTAHPVTETGRDSKRVGSLFLPLPSSFPPPRECVQRYVRAEDWCVSVAGEETGASEIGDSTQTAKSRCLRLCLLQRRNVLVLPILCFDVHGALKPSLLLTPEKWMRFRFWNYCIGALLGTLSFYPD